MLGADVGIACLALIYWGFASPGMLLLSGWAFFVAGLGGILMSINGILEGAGMKFPVGSPIIKSSSTGS